MCFIRGRKDSHVGSNPAESKNHFQMSYLDGCRPLAILLFTLYI